MSWVYVLEDIIAKSRNLAEKGFRRIFPVALDNPNLFGLLAFGASSLAVSKGLEFLVRNLWGVSESAYAYTYELPFLAMGMTFFGIPIGKNVADYLKRTHHLNRLGFGEKGISEGVETIYVRPKKHPLLMVWDSLYEFRQVWTMFLSIVPYYVTKRPITIVAGVIGIYSLLSLMAPYAHSDVLFHNIAKLKYRFFRNGLDYASELESISNDTGFTAPMVDLMSYRFDGGRFDEGHVLANRLLEGGLVLPKSMKRMGYFHAYLGDRVIELYRRIDAGKASQVTYLELATILGTVRHDKAYEVFNRMISVYDEPEHYLQAFWYYHKIGDVEKMRSYLATAIDRIILNSDKYRREPVGRDASNNVFGIDVPLLSRRAVLKMGSGFDSLKFEFDRIEEAGRIFLNTPYSAPENFLVDEIGGRAVYISAHMHRKTLLECMELGIVGFDEQLAAWEPTVLLHKGIKPEVSVIGYVPVAERLHSGFERQYLGFSEREKALMTGCAEAIEAILGGSRRVFCTDGHPENRLYQDGMYSIIDLEDKGVVAEEEDFVSLVRYTGSLGNRESEAIMLTGIEPIRFDAAAYIRNSRWFSAWMNPSRPGKLRDAIAKTYDNIVITNRLLDDVGYAYPPMPYSRFRPEFKAANEGWRMLHERLAAYSGV